MQRQRGTVTWINIEEGYGFAQPEADSALEVYLHKSSIDDWTARPLQVGDLIEFTLDYGPRGPFAAEVVRCSA